tara:strand:- start:520 stop:1245 length:726 start_codon:yes stop_codon:yes gene_type:complete
MYTLRVCHQGEGFSSDNYVANLSITSETAEAKAKDYFNRCYSDRDDASFQGFADFQLNERGAPKPWERAALALVADDRWPFGKNKGKSITDAEDGYLLWWAEQEINGSTSHPAAALIARCAGIALERDLYAKRDAAKAEREARWAAEAAGSDWIGELDTRQTFTATVERIRTFENNWGEESCVQNLRTADGDLIVYWGWSELGDEGSQVQFDARIKRHDEFRNQKQTIVNRPTKIKLEEAA